MGLLLLLTLFSSICLVTQASGSGPDCPAAAKCGGAAPEILYPFHVNVENDDSKLCGLSGFELSCRENKTMIQLPGYGDLVVKAISYDTRKMDLLDPKSCVHQVFLNLNLSLTPFRYYYVVKNYTYLNCSHKLSPSFDEVSCLSGSGRHVYTVEPSSPVPESCRPIKTVAIPFSFSPYLAGDNGFGLGLTWGMPGCVDSTGSDYTGFKTKSKWIAIVFGIGVFILAVAFMLRVKGQKPKELENEVESEKLLGLSV